MAARPRWRRPLPHTARTWWGGVAGMYSNGQRGLWMGEIHPSRCFLYHNKDSGGSKTLPGAPSTIRADGRSLASAQHGRLAWLNARLCARSQWPQRSRNGWRARRRQKRAAESRSRDGERRAPPRSALRHGTGKTLVVSRTVHALRVGACYMLPADPRA